MIVKKKRSHLRIKLFLLAAIITTALFSFDARIRPMIQTYACNQASNRVLKIVNQSIFRKITLLTAIW
ncbi:MAG: hypothetical protein RR528_04545 [Angelakisella sp.]